MKKVLENMERYALMRGQDGFWNRKENNRETGL
jgi:hypothetical protein